MTKTILAALVAASLAACASVQPVPGASRVRVVSATQATACTFKQGVEFKDVQFLTVGKDPYQWRVLAEQGIRNAAAEAGGNAVVITHDGSNWFVGTFRVFGDAYRCAA